jgi:hypothetical protein
MSFLHQVSDMSYQALQGMQFIPLWGRLKPVRGQLSYHVRTGLANKPWFKILRVGYTSTLPEQDANEDDLGKDIWP